MFNRQHSINLTTNDTGKVSIAHDAEFDDVYSDIQSAATWCESETAPQFPVTGLKWYKASTNEVKRWTGSAWELVKGFKTGSFTRSTTTATGTQAITGVGFKPSAVIILATVNGAAGRLSIGFSAGETEYAIFDQYNTIANAWSISSGGIVHMRQGSAYAYSYYASVNSMDSDGFTLSWTKEASAVDGETITCYYLALR